MSPSTRARTFDTRGRAAAAVVAAGVLFASAGAVGSAANDRDVSSASVDIAGGIAIAPGGRIILAGLSRTRSYSAYGIALARYTDRGALDARFGTGGKVLTDFGAHSEVGAKAVAVQPDGRIVAAGGVSEDGGYRGRFALVRDTQTGNLDATFGRHGKVETAFGSLRVAAAVAIALQPDGKLVAVGVAEADPVNGPYHFALARYTRRGSLDRGFGRGGKVVSIFQSNGKATAVAIQRDGKLLVVGTRYINGTGGFVLARYEKNGRLDQAFGKNGRVIASGADPSAVAVQQDGKIVVLAGTALLRYRSDGTLDPSFGVGGKVTNIPGFVDALAIQADGKLVVAGASEGRCNCQDARVFMIARWTSDGSPDLNFGRGGKVTTAFRDGATADGVAVVRAGKIVASGTVGGKDFALARYTSSGRLDGSFGKGGKVVTDFSSAWRVGRKR